MSQLAILTSVYHPYRWLAPVMQAQLDRLWEAHPPLFCAGVTEEEASGVATLPLSDATLPRDWCVFMREACETLRARGFTHCYLIPEEHPPLGTCHAQHLNETLPRWMEELGAAYIALLGWDHRRAVHLGTPVGEAFPGLRRLDAPRAPRFQLHPALWSFDALIACLDLALAHSNHSPWGFENTGKKHDAPLPAEIRNGCYAIHGAVMSAQPPAPVARAGKAAAHFLTRRLISVATHLPQPWKSRYWQALAFDHFFYEGPYPMYFGGVMTRGAINEPYWQCLLRDPARAELCAPLVRAVRENLRPSD